MNEKKRVRPIKNRAHRAPITATNKGWVFGLSGYRAEKAITVNLRLQHQYLLLEIDNVAATAPDWDQDDVDYYVLMDVGNNLTALYRYCVAVKTERDEIAAEFLYGAIQEYSSGRAIYDEVWGDLIPAELRALVRSRVGDTPPC